MRPVNLIPPEERRGERAPLRRGPLAYVVVGALVLAFVSVYALVSTGNSIAEKESEVAILENELASAESRAQALQSFASFASLEQSRAQTVSDLARSRFDWERVLRELALVIPADVSLKTLSGSISAGATAEAPGGTSGASTGSPASASSIPSPTLELTGCAGGQETVARLVASLRDVDGVTRVGLANSAETVEGGSTASGGGGGQSCVPPETVSFEITVAFDEVVVDSSTGGITPPATPEDAAVPQTEAARESVESAEERSTEAVDRYVPGA